MEAQKKVSMKAYAKVNLMLDILGKRENGYHELDMVMQQVSLADEVSLGILTGEEEEVLRGQGTPVLKSAHPVFLKVEYIPLTSDETLAHDMSQEEDSKVGDMGILSPEKNIAVKAVEKCLEAGNTAGRSISPKGALLLEIRKKIPVAAGLAGGSADAAAALRLTNELMGFNMSLKKLQEIGVRLGADVPYCILGGTARAEGIGEVLTPLSPLGGCYILIIKPSVGVSTAWAYGQYDKMKPDLHFKVRDMIEALEREKQDIDEIGGLLGNVLERVTVLEHPVINEIKAKMKERGAVNSLMSGSGPSVFGIYKEKEEAEGAALMFKKEGFKEVFVTNPL